MRQIERPSGCGSPECKVEPGKGGPVQCQCSERTLGLAIQYWRAQAVAAQACGETDVEDVAMSRDGWLLEAEKWKGRYYDLHAAVQREVDDLLYCEGLPNSDELMTHAVPLGRRLKAMLDKHYSE